MTGSVSLVRSTFQCLVCRLIRWQLAVLAVLTTGVSAREEVSLFADPNYVSQRRFELGYTRQALEILGYSVRMFTGIRPEDWNDAFENRLVVVPMMNDGTPEFSDQTVDAKGYFDVQVVATGPFAKPPRSCFLDGLHNRGMGVACPGPQTKLTTQKRSKGSQCRRY